MYDLSRTTQVDRRIVDTTPARLQALLRGVWDVRRGWGCRR